MFLVLYRSQHPKASSITFTEPQLCDCKTQPLPSDTTDHNYCLRSRPGIALLYNAIAQTREKFPEISPFPELRAGEGVAALPELLVAGSRKAAAETRLL